jgi:hypothetical protein
MSEYIQPPSGGLGHRAKVVGAISAPYCAFMASTTRADGDSELLRALAGRPTIWSSAVWVAIGLAWVALSLFEGFETFRVVVGIAWLTLGLVRGAIALRDRRRGLGHYAVQRRRPAQT